MSVRVYDDKGQRVDQHSVSEWNPEEYEFVGQFDGYAEPRFEIDFTTGEYHRRETMASRLREEWMDELHSNDNDWHGQCQRCGSWHRYVVVTMHEPTGDYVCVGRTCAQNYLGISEDEYEFQRLQTQRKKQETMEQEKERWEQFKTEYQEQYEKYLEIARADEEEDYTKYPGHIRKGVKDALKNGRYEFLKDYDLEIEVTDEIYELLRENFTLEPTGFVESIAHQYFYEGKHLTPNQEEALEDYLERQQETGDVQVPTGKGIEVEGEIVSCKWKETRYGESLKMMVQSDEGWRVWGTVPKSIHRRDVDEVECECGFYVSGDMDDFYDARDQHKEDHPDHETTYGTKGMYRSPDRLKGQRVQFKANIEPSDDDDFGFFKRPRKADIVT